MNPFLSGVAIGLFFGVIFGILIAAFCVVAADSDRSMERMFERESRKNS